MKFKKNVQLNPFVHLNHVIDSVDRAFQEHANRCAVMTSACDSKHSERSLHYNDRAWDFRIWKDVNDGKLGLINKELLLTIVDSIQTYLGSDYDVVIEPTHIHVEYDPDE